MKKNRLPRKKKKIIKKLGVKIINSDPNFIVWKIPLSDIQRNAILERSKSRSNKSIKIFACDTFGQPYLPPDKNVIGNITGIKNQDNIIKSPNQLYKEFGEGSPINNISDGNRKSTNSKKGMAG